MNKETLALIMGKLLGDAHLQKRGRSYRLKIEHSSKQSQYVFWLHKQLSNLCTTTQPPKVHKIKKDESITFYTSSGLYLEELHTLFYKKNVNGVYIKTITQELIDKLPMEPILLAVLWMDDGNARDDCYSGKLATQGFSEAESELLCSYFLKWGIQCHVVFHSVDLSQHYISMPTASFQTLVDIIEPIIMQIPDLQYKLNAQRKPCND